MNYELEQCSSHSAIKILLPKHLTAVLIGEKGNNIKNLCNITSAIIRVSPPEVYYIGTLDRIVLICGSEDSCLIAIKYIITLVALSTKIDAVGAMRSSLRWDPLKIDITRLIDPSIYIALRTTIPAEAGGVILGREGRNIRLIQDESGARVHVSSKGEVAAINERLVTIAGSCDSCEKCMKMVLEKLSELAPYQLDNFSRGVQTHSLHTIDRPPRCAESYRDKDPSIYVNTSNSTSPKPETATAQSPDDDNTRDRRNSKTPSDASGDTTSSSSSSNYSNINRGECEERDVINGPSKGPRPHRRGGPDNSRYSDFGGAYYENSIPFIAGVQSPSHRSGSFHPYRGYGHGYNSPHSYYSPPPHYSQPNYYPPQAPSPQKTGAVNPVEPYTVPYPQMRLVRNDSNGVSALDSIAEIADHIYALTTIEMQIPDNHIGMVFGRRGFLLKDIQHASQADIFVSKRGDYAPGTMNRRVSISGSPANARAAMLLIQKKLDAMPSAACYESAKRNVEEGEKRGSGKGSAVKLNMDGSMPTPPPKSHSLDIDSNSETTTPPAASINSEDSRAVSPSSDFLDDNLNSCVDEKISSE